MAPLALSRDSPVMTWDDTEGPGGWLRRTQELPGIESTRCSPWALWLRADTKWHKGKALPPVRLKHSFCWREWPALQPLPPGERDYHNEPTHFMLWLTKAQCEVTSSFSKLLSSRWPDGHPESMEITKQIKIKHRRSKVFPCQSRDGEKSPLWRHHAGSLAGRPIWAFQGCEMSRELEKTTEADPGWGMFWTWGDVMVR